MSLRTYLAAFPDRCAHGYHLTAQHPQLCDCQNAEAGKSAGIAAADAAASPDDRARIDAAIRQVALRGGVFSANDVRPLIGRTSGPLVGARFNALARAGVIREVGFEKSKGNTHAHHIRTWSAA